MARGKARVKLPIRRNGLFLARHFDPRFEEVRGGVEIELLFLYLTVEALQGKTCQDSLLSAERMSLGARISASFDTFCLVAPQPYEVEKEVQLRLTRTQHWLSNDPSIPRFYAAPNFLKTGIKMPRSVVFWTTSTIKDEQSAAKFYYTKTVSGML